MLILKTVSQINTMDIANKIVHDILYFAKDNAVAGMSSFDLDLLMENKLNKSKAISAFKGYKGYPNVSCISINSTIVHGVPSKKIILKDGDIVSIDFGVYYDGFAGDSAISFVIGRYVNEQQKQLVANTKLALYSGINAMHIGNRLYDISLAISLISDKNKYGNIRHFCGHGIGKVMHEEPNVFNYIEKKEPNIRLQEGMVLALEPMFTLGSSKYRLLEDNWTAETDDKSIAAHWELSIAITKNGPKILGSIYNG